MVVGDGGGARGGRRWQWWWWLCVVVHTQPNGRMQVYKAVGVVGTALPKDSNAIACVD
jgi:hypothetical protein